MSSLFFSPKQLCERWGLSQTTLYRMLERRDIAAVKFSRSMYRIPAAEVERFEAERLQERRGSTLRQIYGRE